MILGIDTGGTYTDGVILEPFGKTIISKAKAFTTKSNLMLGIRQCIENLHIDDPKSIKLVCLSTTLATNAIVEGRGGKVGLLIAGGEIKESLPADCVFNLHGKLDIKGKIKEDLDSREVMDAVEKLKSRNIQGIAISGYASVRNPVHEFFIKNIVREKMDIPVVCAHELSSTLGFYDRTVTAALNARLIPLISDLIMATRHVLDQSGINARIMIVKGDGSLMQKDYALGKPIETILSGPAASIIGGMYLTGKKDALIVDMGGTTTDIANLHNGSVKISRSGPIVGGWRTQIEAAEICTYGIGGDSFIQAGKDGKLKIGPQKVQPLCVVAEEYPYLKQELETFYSQTDKHEWFSEQETDCFSVITKPGNLNEAQEALFNLLSDGPHSAFYLSQNLQKDVESLGLTNLVNAGFLQRISLTPTDILHAMGKYMQWDASASILGVKILAQKAGISEDTFIERAYSAIIDALTDSLLQSTVEFENKSFKIQENTAAKFFIEKAFYKDQKELLQVNLKITKPVIAIGAPAEAWLKPVCDALHTNAIIPLHAEVANAIGAATGKVTETAEALIRPGKEHKEFIVHAPSLWQSFETLEEAKAFAVPVVRQAASEAVKNAGSKKFEIIETLEDKYASTDSNGEKVFIETRLKAVAIGSPEWNE